MKRLFPFFFLFLCVGIHAQVGIGTINPDSSSVLDITSTNKGMLIPRLTIAQRTGITAPATGLFVFNTDTKQFNYYDGTVWKAVSDGIGWSLTGNSGTVDGTNFIGTTDNKPFNIRVNNEKAGKIDNTTNGLVAFGYQSLNNNTTGARNTAMGYQSLSHTITGVDNTAMGYQSLNSNTTGSSNTATGSYSLFSNTTGKNNTANGDHALYSNIASENTANGYQSLYSNTTGYHNTASGFQALLNNIAGNQNTANGHRSLANNNGNYNTAIGQASLENNIGGSDNTAVGYQSLKNNTTGNWNTASGTQSLSNNTTGIDNTASGFRSLLKNEKGSGNTAHGFESIMNTTGSSNTAIGYEAGSNNTSGTSNTFIGYETGLANTTGKNNTFLGLKANASSENLQNATAIGYNAVVGASNSLVLGATGNMQVSVGIGTTTPNSYLETAGSFGTAITTTASDITLDKTHYTVIITGGSGATNITLPAATTASRRSYRIINQRDPIRLILIMSPSVTISSYIDFDGNTASTVPSHSKIEIQSDGTNWYQVD